MLKVSKFNNLELQDVPTIVGKWRLLTYEVSRSISYHLEVNFASNPPSPLEFPGPLTPPPPWNFQFPPWWGYGYFLELHILRGSEFLIPPTLKTERNRLFSPILRGSEFLIPPTLKTERNQVFPAILRGSEFLIPPTFKTERNRLFPPILRGSEFLIPLTILNRTK